VARELRRDEGRRRGGHFTAGGNWGGQSISKYQVWYLNANFSIWHLNSV